MNRKPSDFPITFPLPSLYIYRATVTTEDRLLQKTTNLTRFTLDSLKTLLRPREPQTSFNNHSKRMSIELSKHVWNLKDSNINFRITWKILKQVIAYNPSSKRCNLCLWEKYLTICKAHLATLNKRNELVS